MNNDGIPYSGFYTQDEAREIVKYAKERHITVIPEIDLPGHMQAALAAYPELGCTGGLYEVWKMWGVSEDVLCAGNDKTLTFIEDVLNEIVDIFPSEYIHVGGDECPKTAWINSEYCQSLIKQLGLKDDVTPNVIDGKKHTKEEKLQSYFITRMEKYLNSKGRNIIGWDENSGRRTGPECHRYVLERSRGWIKCSQSRTQRHYDTKSIRISGSVSGRTGDSSRHHRWI